MTCGRMRRCAAAYGRALSGLLGYAHRGHVVIHLPIDNSSLAICWFLHRLFGHWSVLRYACLHVLCARLAVGRRAPYPSDRPTEARHGTGLLRQVQGEKRNERRDRGHNEERAPDAQGNLPDLWGEAQPLHQKVVRRGASTRQQRHNCGAVFLWRSPQALGSQGGVH